MIFVLMFAILGGISNVTSRMFNARLGMEIGVLQSTLFNYITGLAVSFVVMLLAQEPPVAVLVPQSPSQLLIYCGGLMSVVSVNISTRVAARLSAFLMTMLVFISQLVGGILLDWLTAGILSPGKVAGGALVLLGLVCYQLAARRDEASAAA